MTLYRATLAGLLLLSSPLYAAEDPISWEIISASLPSHSSLYSIYHITYEMTSNLPFVMPSPIMIDSQTSTDEFEVIDNCTQNYLQPKETCQVLVILNPENHGHKSASLNISYGDSQIPLPPLTTHTATAAESWIGAIGVNYVPAHYPNNYPINFHDVAYVGMNSNNQPITNMYAELAQLQAAGFNTVRSYETVEYSWIALIEAANQLNMNVIYEAVIPQDGDSSDITAAVSVLNNVIDAVSTTVFADTVSLVFAGHENYNGSNIDYLIDAVTSLQAALTAQDISAIPVSSALVSGDLVTPGNPDDMQSLINSYSATAPLGFDPYPFQWGVPVATAVSSLLPPQTINSIAWDYAQVMQQSFYQSPRAILMAETGWATQGSNSSYFCYQNPTNPCEPSVANAATYLSALYSYVRNASNLSSALIFYAYDDPDKDPFDANDAENFYGMFDANCNLKNNNTTLLPNTAFIGTSNQGCQGFSQGALFVVVGGSVTTQPPYTVEITQQNPVTLQNADITVTVPTTDRTNTNINPWPNFLVFNNAQIQINGSTAGNVCTGTALVSSASPPVLTLPAALTCTGAAVNCFGVNCFLPANF